MDGGKRKVGMIRVESKEQVFDREALLGRDVESVFPTESKAAIDSEADQVTDAVKEALGSVKFVTESEVEAIRSREAGGGAGGSGASKPLAQILSERKQQKDEEHQEKMRLIKQGSNKPLDADEMDFLESVELKRRKIADTRKAEEETELLAFQLAREQMQQKTKPAAKASQQERKPSAAKKPPLAILRVKPKPKAQPKPKAEEEEGKGIGGGLGLVADYGSDSD